MAPASPAKHSHKVGAHTTVKVHTQWFVRQEKVMAKEGLKLREKTCSEETKHTKRQKSTSLRCAIVL